MKKDRYLYFIILFFWIIISSLSFLYLVLIQWNNSNLMVIKFFLIINWFFVNILFCNGIKDLIIVLHYHINNKKRKSLLSINYDNPKVLLLYTTYNDFDEESLCTSMKQNYKNFEVFILDDSTNDEYKKKINEFVDKHKNVKVIRRENREGFKAGNINNFLKNKNDYDYFVLLDSDEIIPNNFIEESLKYFNDSKIGIVQANHKGTRWSNYFDYLGSQGILPAWTTFISNKNQFGCVTLNGHGAMIKKECYISSGGFPEIVAEDLGLTVNILKKGWDIKFANDIICEEKFPIDYIAFKKRNIKWTQGNFEFFKKIGWKIPFLKIPFFRKIDLIISTTSLSLTIFSVFAALINFSVFYPLGFLTKNYWFIWIFLILFSITPILNDLIWLVKNKKIKLLFAYIPFCFLLYPSMLVTSITTIVKSIFGKKAKFIVTPKNENHYTIKEAIKYNIVEIITGFSILIISITIASIFASFRGLVWIWIIVLIIPMLSTPFLTMLSNKKHHNANL